MRKCLKDQPRGGTGFDWICETMKMAFKTEKKARTYINQRRAIAPNYKVNWTYKCKFCHFYHLTSRPPRESIPKPDTKL